MSAFSNPILLYDGICGLCNRVVQFALRRDANGVFRFAALQSALAAEILRRHQVDPDQINTFFIVVDFATEREQLLKRSDATLYLLRRLAPPWPVIARLGAILPRPIRDAVYRFIANNRYQIFGKYDSCPIPTEEQRSRFLDLGSLPAKASDISPAADAGL